MRYKPSLQSHATAMRKEPSRAERALWKLLRNRQFEGYKFRRQHQIDVYIADFACIRAKLIIEADGPSHDLPEQAEHDFHRTAALTKLGWRVLRLSNAEILADESAVIAKIAAALSDAPSP